jgi:hypothetical protein
VTVVDGRRAPYCWQSVHTLAHIRGGWQSTTRLVFGLAVYLALTEIANEQRAHMHYGAGEPFEATRRWVAEKAGGISDRTLDRVLGELERLRVVRVDRRRVGGVHLPSRYVLIEGGDSGSPLPNGSREGVATPVRTYSQEGNGQEPPNPQRGSIEIPARPRGQRQRDHDRYRERIDELAGELDLPTAAPSEVRWALDQLSGTVPVAAVEELLEPLNQGGREADDLRSRINFWEMSRG